jgi:hypothetical protein
MRLVHLSGLLLLLMLLTACINKSSEDKLANELQTITSWSATAQMVGEAWVRGAVPTVYAKQTLSTAQQELQKETDMLVRLSITSTQRPTLLENLQRLNQTVGQMSTAAQQTDRTRMSQKIKQLVLEEQKIKKFAQTTGMQL